MYDEPGDPGREAGEAYSFDVGDRFRTTNRGQIALVDVPERLRGAASKAVANHPGDVAAFLHRDRRKSWQCHDRPIALDDPDHVAGREDLRVVGQRQIRRDSKPAGSVDLRPGRRRQGRRERRRGDAGGPENGFRRDGIVADRHAAGLHARDRGAGAHLDAEPFEIVPRRRAQRLRECGEQRRHYGTNAGLRIAPIEPERTRDPPDHVRRQELHHVRDEVGSHGNLRFLESKSDSPLG